MSEESASPNELSPAGEQSAVQARTEMAQKLKSKGAQSMSYKEYMARKEKKEKARVRKPLPPMVKTILSIPLILIGGCCVLFILYMMFQIITGKSAAPGAKTSILSETP